MGGGVESESCLSTCSDECWSSGRTVSSKPRVIDTNDAGEWCIGRMGEE